MQLAHTTRGLRRGTAFLGLAVLLGTVALTLTQCKMVDERLTGISFGKSQPANCLSTCAHAFNDSIRVESVLHVANVHACGDDVCIAIEEIRHEAAVNRIQAGREACQEQCHHQGGGTGR
jgi:hypothetical protein